MFAVLLAQPGFADEIDIENAPTPTRLAALLPEGGIDAVDVDVWVVTQTKIKKGRVGQVDRYTHWSIKPVDGRLVVQMSQGTPHPRQMLTLQRFIYSAAGELEAYHEIREIRGKRSADMIGKVEGESLVIKPNPETGVLNATYSKERTVALKDFDAHVPIAWLPLVRAYHIRKGHLGYHCATIDLMRTDEQTVYAVEDVGSEVLKIDDKDVVGHLLMETITTERKGRQTSTTAQTMVLTNGSVVSSQSENSNYRYITRRTPEETVREKFGVEE